MRRQTKNVIGEYMSYGINDLVSTWDNEGWQGLAELAKKLELDRFGFGYGDDCNTHRVKHALEESYEELICEVSGRRLGHWWSIGRWCAFVLIPPEKKYTKSLRKLLDYKPDDVGHGGSAADDAKLLKCYGKISHALANSKTIYDAFCNTVEPKILKAHEKHAKEYWGEEAQSDNQNILRKKIPKKYAEVFELISKWTRKQASHAEVWWSCVWWYIRDNVKEMLQIQDCILKDVPLTDEQRRLLSEYMGYGNPRGIIWFDDDGNCSYEIYLDVRDCQYMPYRDIENIGCGLLTQPAFALGQQLLRRWTSPRFIKRCHAPSCGKAFYTKRSKATACPSKHDDNKSACALEWIRYKRYLTKISRNPEEDWENKRLQRDFISYDKS